MKINSRGQVLIVALAALLVLLILTPHVVRWVQSESEWTVKQQQSSAAFNLANGAIERGTWKLKSSTSTWAAAAAGTVIAGYNFDTTYQDVSSGTYRIKFSSGPSADQVTVTAEARDDNREEVRAIQAVYQNQSIPGPILTGGNLTMAGAFEPHWGPVMAQGNITISGVAATKYYPRKYSKQVVTGTAGNPRDTNGPTPPNTDNQEWWSAYSVPDLPMLDFATMRSSAAANGTLNYYNVNASSTGHVMTGYTGTHYTGGTTTMECRTPGGTAFASHANHFYDSLHHPKSQQNLIWYWDGDLILTGNCFYSTFACLLNFPNNHRIGLRGTIIVRGNLTIYSEDALSFTASVPSSSWREYAKIDTSSTNQYPADNGYQANRATFGCGSETWTGGPSAAYTDVGIRGFLYVGGNMTIQTNAAGDYAGAVWVVGNATNMNSLDKSLIFYDATLDVPVLNVILVQQSWKEIAPSATAWAP